MIILSALGKKNGNWDLVQVSANTVKDLFSEYTEFRIVVSHEVGGDRYEIRSTDYSNIVSSEEVINIVEALERDKAKLVKRTITQLSHIKRVVVKDLYEYPVTISRGNHTRSGGQAVPVTMRSDLAISSKINGVTLGLERDCLISVNGTIYPTVLIDDILFVKNASWELSGDRSATITVMDFTEVGGIDKVRIDKYNLTSRRTLGADQLYLSMCVIDVQQDMTDKQVFSVEAGMLEIDGSTIERFGPSTIKMEIANEVAIKRILKRPLVHRSSYQKELGSETTINKINFRPDRYLTQGDSMICIFREKNICMHIENLNINGLENEYSFYRHVEGIAVTEDGEVVNYKCVPTDNGDFLIRGQEQNTDVFFEGEDSNGLDIVSKVVGGDIKTKPKKARVVDFYKLAND